MITVRRIAKELGTPKLVVPKFIFPKERFFEWQKGDEWLARFMGVGRHELQPFEQRHDGYWTMPCIGFEGRDDEIRSVPLRHFSDYPNERIEYTVRSGFDVARLSPLTEFISTPSTTVKHLALQRFVIAECQIFAYVSPELTDRRAILRLVALLEEAGVQVRFREPHRSRVEILPLDFFL